VLRGIFGPKREGVTGGWRSLHNEELHNLYASLCFLTRYHAMKAYCGSGGIAPLIL
jgi:hypothetical protein